MQAIKHEVVVMKDETRLALLEQSVGHINETLLRIEKRFDKIDCRIDAVEQGAKDRFDKLQIQIEEVRKNSWSQFRWIMGFIFTFFSAFALAYVKAKLF